STRSPYTTLFRSIRLVNVRKVLERIVADEVGAALQASTAADVRVALDVVFPGFARLLHLVGDVVNRQRQTGGGSAIVVSGDHAAGQVQVVANRRMGIGPIMQGHPVLVGEGGQVRHGAAAIGAAKARVLSFDNKDVPELRHCATTSAGRHSEGGRITGHIAGDIANGHGELRA